MERYNKYQAYAILVPIVLIGAFIFVQNFEYRTEMFLFHV